MFPFQRPLPSIPIRCHAMPTYNRFAKDISRRPRAKTLLVNLRMDLIDSNAS